MKNKVKENKNMIFSYEHNKTPRVTTTMDEKYKQLVSSRIREARIETGLKAEEFARKSQINVSRLHNWECGIRVPKADTIALIAHHFNRSPSYLIGFTNEKHNPHNYAVPDSVLSVPPLLLHSEVIQNKNIPEMYLSIIVIDDNSSSPLLEKGDFAIIDASKSPNNEYEIFAIETIIQDTKTIKFKWVKNLKHNDHSNYWVCDYQDYVEGDNEQQKSYEFTDTRESKVTGKLAGKFNWLKP